MTVEENKTACKALVEMFGGTRSLDDAAKYLSESAVDHEGIPGVDTNGIEGFRRAVTVYRTAFPDMTMHIGFTVAEGDLVVTQYHAKGTNSGPLSGMPPTGRQIEIEGVDIVRFEGGKAVEHWGYMEQAKMLQQLGLMPQ